MANLIFKDYIDKYNDYSKAGNAFFSVVSPLIAQDEIIRFDMKDLDSVSTVFLNASFGQLIDLYGIERVKKSFRFANILRTQIERIKKYFTDYSILTNPSSKR